ncbi:IS66 family insertion sequence element accessory protein TnpA [Microbulbifer sp. DLAB2-AA]|uniref:IS66 family insertion sequence element accessory protein TnpA n=1 Tax=Microbulbifer sp. DLAB2-AA TaxID=3243394 RepID=UPI00403A4AE6
MPKRTQSEWLTLFAEHRSSGLSAAAFCREKQLCPKYFSLRRRQLKASNPTTTSDPQPFIQAIPAIANKATGDKAIVLHGRWAELTFPSSLSPQWLATFLKALT